MRRTSAGWTSGCGRRGFFKTRTLATREVQAGHVRLNAVRVTKAATTVGQGDTLTFAQGNRIRLIRVLATGERRGPATEAQLLYHDLDPPPPAGTPAEPRRDGPGPGFDGNTHGGGRPSKKDRRTYDRTRHDPAD